jgi:dienelactone hydrolase
MKKISLILVVFAFLVYCASDGQSQEVGDTADHRELLSKYYRLEKPNGAGPFPAALLVPCSGGFEAKNHIKFHDYVQSQLVELGFVVLRVNYLAVRNANRGWQVSAEDVAGDIGIAVEYLRQQPFVKKGAINVMGWSWGGGGALQALGRIGSREPVQVDAVVAYYPSCNIVNVQSWDLEVPVLVLVGSNDNVTPLSFCETLFGHLPKQNRPTVRVYDKAHHHFDNFELQARNQSSPDAISGYNEADAKSAWIEVTNFLRK